MLTRFGDFIYRARWGVLLVALAVLIGAGIFGFSAFGQFKNGSSGALDSESARAEQLLDSKLGGASPDVIILMRSDTLQATDAAFTQAATDLLARLQNHSEVASLTSYYSTHSQSFLSSDGHETFALLQLTSQDLPTKIKQYNALQPLLTSPTLQVTTGGTIPVNIAINTQINTDLEHAEIFTFPILAILLLFVFSGVIAAGLPLLIGGRGNCLRIRGFAPDYAFYRCFFLRHQCGNHAGPWSGHRLRTLYSDTLPRRTGER